MSKVSDEISEFIRAVESNDPSVVERLSQLNLNDTNTPLQILVNLRHWDGLQYAVKHASCLGGMLRCAAFNQWFEAIDLILPHATLQDIVSAAKVSANTNKIESLKYLADHCDDLCECVLPACFGRAKTALDFLLERGDAQSVRNTLKDITRENDPNHYFSLIHGEKIWGALEFLRIETTRWELKNATKDCGASQKSKKI